MIFSIHIPKTAGTSFRHALEARYGDGLALYYGVLDPKTTDGLRVRREELAEAAARLPERGFEVLHGHFHAAHVAPLVESPSQVWTWLRDPVERTLSHYEFYRQEPLELKALADRVKSGDVGLGAFARTKEIQEIQSRFLKGLALSELGFVGISEHFELGLSLLFGEDAPQLKRRYNTTDRDDPVPDGKRDRIAAANIRDMQLYAEALRLFVARVAAGKAAAPTRPGLVGRLLRPAG
ncbi:hypothetical protein [Chenggangzhangella methanolivorans]|uniref:Sulfotransferase family protein n=1 Tax=Chenggangzhangella methanolivorans TaxID=1437009 RepID=A0A9E6R588_9HYPH|nr:hypothetical protein [Chenggangzhangella methanolivorans]QZN98432.1 hypothetical protein K6K41_15235 [Chenggangzhangella methanolivorans]